MKVASHIGNIYEVTHDRAPKEFWSVYISWDKRKIRTPYDMEIRVGGMRMYINKDGTMVSGYETFEKETLARIYKFLKEG